MKRLIGIEISSDHPGIDEDKIMESLEEIIELFVKRSKASVDDLEIMEPGEDCSNWVDAEIDSVGCGDVTDLVDVEFSLDENEIVVDSVQLNQERAIEALRELNSMIATVTEY